MEGIFILVGIFSLMIGRSIFTPHNPGRVAPI